MLVPWFYRIVRELKRKRVRLVYVPASLIMSLLIGIGWFYVTAHKSKCLENLSEYYRWTRYLCEARPFNLKFILQWTPGDHSPFRFLEIAQMAFVRNNCTYTNCYVTDKWEHMGDYRCFHAVLFAGHEVVYLAENKLPGLRDPRQKYIFAAMESAQNYPACAPHLDNFFNWTWSYKVDSDVRWGYITFFHTNGSVAGPKRDVVWPEVMAPINDATKDGLRSKTKAAAWFASNCQSTSKREELVEEIRGELKRYGLDLDTYGACGQYECPRNEKEQCSLMLQRDYYFYLSFENSFAEDYVTEKVLTALNYFTVPVVFGGANYSRFLPPGSYLDAKELGAARLAKVMASTIANKTSYYQFFRWRNHYTYAETSFTLDVCNLCALLNNDDKLNSYSSYKDFREWWNPEGSCAG